MREEIDSRLAELKNRGVPYYDPAGFRYIESLLQRARDKQESISRILEKKAQDALDDLRERFDQAGEEASEIVSRVSLEYPESADRIQALYVRGEFKKVKHLEKRLYRNSGQRAVSLLLNHMIRKTSPLEERNAPSSIDDILKKHDHDIIQSIENSREDTETTSTPDNSELKAYHLLKSSLAKRHSDKLVVTAIRERPENAGPLNSQMLAIRALSEMRNLSPDYLNRFVTYLDTLLWLERID